MLNYELVDQTTTNQLPKKIWMLWLQGYEKMPPVVQKCYESWHKYNPDWEIILLDENTIADYLDIEPLLAEKTKVTVSDIVRVNLLRKYGGVWVDATCHCNRPLSEWLPDYMPSGFFAFSSPKPDRMMSNWFLAAEQGNPLLAKLTDTINEFWGKYQQLDFFTDKAWLRQFLMRTQIYHFLKRRPYLWINFIFQDMLKVIPYFWFHYTFEKLYRKDAKFRAVWDATPKLSAKTPHYLWHHGLDQPINSTAQQHILERKSHVYKLTWKVNDEMFQKGHTLHYLLYESGV